LGGDNNSAIEILELKKKGDAIAATAYHSQMMVA